MKYRKEIILGGVLVLALILAGCAPGNVRWDGENQAGFWAGLWHGFICLIAFIISLFSKNVQMYEVNNVGALYNLGFLIGVACFFGGSWSSQSKKRRESRREREWDEIADKMEVKIRRGIKNWLEESEKEDEEWEEIGRKIEEKIKRELKDWAEK